MASASAPWIVGPRYDMTWFFGGAAASLLLLGLYAGGVSIVVLFWVWLLAFDGPHIAAAFTRTYLDREEWRQRGGLLWSALLSFAVGPACLLLGLAIGSPQPFLLFLGLSTFYGYYHVVRQHYGFLALYRAHDSQDAASLALDRWSLYVGCWTPYAWFLLTHPRARAALGMPATLGSLEQTAATAMAALFGLCLAVLLARYLSQPAALRRPKAAYLLLTLVLYGLIYFAVGPREPVYAESTGPDQDFLLLSALVTVFHNVQYLGLVWFHNRNRYGRAGDFGPARQLARSPWEYLAACLGFSLVVYLGFACSTSVFPACQVLPGERLGPFTLSQLGLCLWWGLAIHHYYLDQKIWRVSRDPELRRNLGLV